jgi:flagellar basal-body rod modification protein FlgD
MTGAQPTYSTGTTEKKSGFLGKDDFLKLLATQLKMQDPQAPSDINQTTQQMTQFSIVEQLMTMNEGMSVQQTLAGQTQAMSLIGKTVSWLAADGTAKSGVVDRVDVAGGVPTLHVGEDEVAPGFLTSVS